MGGIPEVGASVAWGTGQEVGSIVATTRTPDSLKDLAAAGVDAREEVRSTIAIRSWLHKIATNACLDQLRKARRRRALPHLVAPSPSTAMRLGPAADERLWVEPVPDMLLDVEDDAGAAPDG